MGNWWNKYKKDIFVPVIGCIVTGVITWWISTMQTSSTQEPKINNTSISSEKGSIGKIGTINGDFNITNMFVDTPRKENQSPILQSKSGIKKVTSPNPINGIQSVPSIQQNNVNGDNSVELNTYIDTKPMKVDMVNWKTKNTHTDRIVDFHGTTHIINTLIPGLDSAYYNEFVFKVSSLTSNVLQCTIKNPYTLYFFFLRSDGFINGRIKTSTSSDGFQSIKLPNCDVGYYSVYVTSAEPINNFSNSQIEITDGDYLE